MSRKLIILYTANYCDKMKNVFEVDELVKNNCVEFWNLSIITANEQMVPAYTNGLVERKIDTVFQFLVLVWNNRKENPVYAFVMGYCYYMYKIYLILSIFNCTLAYITTGTLPRYQQDLSKARKFKIKIPNISHYISRLFYHTFLIKPADYVLVSCKKVTLYYKTSNRTIMYNSSSGDYVGAIKLMRNNIKKRSEKYIVFLDQYLPFHHDNVLFGLIQVDADYYFKYLNQYFDKIEKFYNCRIIIAAHPSAMKYNNTNYFNGREVVFNETAQLVCDSFAVLTHNTTAVSYVSIFCKPVIFMTMPGLSDYDYGIMNILASELKSKIVDITKDDDVCFDRVSIPAYKQYIQNYLSIIDEGLSNALILSSLLKN